MTSWPAPIFIPSRGRATMRRSAAGLQAEGIPFTFAVEPQEADLYAAEWPGVPQLVLPRRDGGMWYVRQVLLDHCRAQGIPWHWQVDDNIYWLARNVGRRYEKRTWAEAIAGMEQVVARHPTVVMAGPIHRQFGWSQRTPWRYNKRATSCLLLRSDSPADFRELADTKEDVDYALQALTLGLDTILFHEWGMSKPALGKNASGGCVDAYRADRDARAVANICGLWPDYATRTERWGRAEVNVRWDAFKRPVPMTGGAA